MKGNPRSYIARERTVPVGYISEAVIVSGKDTTTADIINTLVTKDISVVKNWVDNKNRDLSRPAAIQLKLYRDGSEFRTAAVTASEHQVSDNVWIYTFNNVPVYNSSGNLSVYTTKEFSAN